jgi:hypothetical protein
MLCPFGRVVDPAGRLAAAAVPVAHRRATTNRKKAGSVRLSQ